MNIKVESAENFEWKAILTSQHDRDRQILLDRQKLKDGIAIARGDLNLVSVNTLTNLKKLLKKFNSKTGKWDRSTG